MLRRGFCFQPLRSLCHAETKGSFEFQVVKARSSSSATTKAAPAVPLDANLSVVKRAGTSLKVAPTMRLKTTHASYRGGALAKGVATRDGIARSCAACR